MAKPNPQLISAIERTVLKLQTGAPYEWGHMGACNCGNLAQELTKLTKGEIHQYAMQRHGDWNEQLIDYCPTSGYPMDLMISKMIDAGLSIDDLAHLERLSDQTILRKISKERRDKMNQNSREDVILYMQTWANLLREKWVENQEISDALRVEKKLNQPALV